jgi:hypothetical protein
MKNISLTVTDEVYTGWRAYVKRNRRSQTECFALLPEILSSVSPEMQKQIIDAYDHERRGRPRITQERYR